MEIADREGLNAVSMRSVAQRLRVAPMSLYNHVPGKEALLDGLVDLVAGDVRIPGPKVRDGRERTHALLRSIRRALLAHPWALPIVARRQPIGPNALRAIEAGLDALHRAGLDDRSAAHAYRALSSFAVGFVSLEAGGFFGAEDRAPNPALVEAVATLKLPRLIAVAPHLLAWDARAEFDRGVDALLDGFLGPRARAARS